MAGRIALDSGAIIKLSSGDTLVRALLRKATEEKWLVIVPAPVLAETLRGGAADAQVHRILKSRENAITLVDLSASAGSDAGERLGKAGMAAHDTVDALIVASSVEAGAQRIVTCDPGDIGPLAGSDLDIISI